MLEDLYRALGLTGSASLEEIKKAYRLLAKEYHPDKNKDGAEKFKEISHAYSILTDPEKRKEYAAKQYAEAPSRQYSYSFNMHDPFANPFGFPFFTRDPPPPPPPQASNPPKSSYTIKTTCSLKLEDIFNGSKVTFAYKEDIHCQTCQGNPRRFKRYDTCSHCGGDGVNSKAPNNSRKAPSDTRCKHCLGKGSLKSYVRCKDCDGKKTINRTVAMRVPKGVHSGHALQLKNKGNLMPDGKTRGGLIFRVQEEPHPVFTRRGDHLYMDVRISLKEALLGFKNKVICTHLDGRTMTATQTAGETIKPDSRKVIQGEGMPVYGSHTNARGDLYITFHVDFPDTIQIPRTREARMAIDDLFETEQERHAKKNAIVIDDDDVAEGQSKNDVISIDDNDTPGPSSKKRKISPANEDEEDNDDDKQPQNILQDAPEDEGMDDPEKVEEEDDELDEDIRDQTFNPFADLFNMFF